MKTFLFGGGFVPGAVIEPLYHVGLTSQVYGVGLAPTLFLM